MPSKRRSSRSISVAGKALPVGLLGEQSHSSLLRSSAAASSRSTGSEKSSPSGTSRSSTSLTAAATRYMP